MAKRQAAKVAKAKALEGVDDAIVSEDEAVVAAHETSDKVDSGVTFTVRAADFRVYPDIWAQQEKEWQRAAGKENMVPSDDDSDVDSDADMEY